MQREDFELLVTTYGKDILRFCRFTTCNNEEGDELYQETMLYLLKNIKKIRFEEAAKSYAISSALYLWKSKKRKALRRHKIIPFESLETINETEGDCIADNTSSVEDTVLYDEEVKKLQICINALPDKYRLPLIMYYSANIQVKEIAKALKLPEATIKTRLKRAKEQLKKHMDEN